MSYFPSLSALFYLAALSLWGAAGWAAAAAPQQAPLPSTPNIAVTPASPSAHSAKALEEALAQQRASLDKQQQAIHLQLAERQKQTPVSSFFSTEPFGPSVPASIQTPAQVNCPPIDGERINALVNSAAQQQSISPALLKAVMKEESAFRPCAVSAMGAQGLMQLMPATAHELHVKDVFDPVQNVRAGAAYLKQMLERYNGDLRLALAGYNAGPSRADQGSSAPFPIETQNYIASILADLGIDSSNNPGDTEDLAPPEEISNQTAPAANEPVKPSTPITAPLMPEMNVEKIRMVPPKP